MLLGAGDNPSNRAWQHRPVPVLRSTALIDAAPRSAAGLLRDIGLSAAALGRDGHRIAAARPLLAPGDEVALRVRLPLGVRVPLRMVVGTVSAQTLTATLLAGPAPCSCGTWSR